MLAGLACRPPLAQSQGLGPVASSSSNAVTRTDSKATSPDQFPLPSGETTLVGGTIRSIDLVRDRMSIHVFGGGQVSVLFDERTRVYRGSQAAALSSLKESERVHVDTVAEGKNIFARSVRIVENPGGQTNGQIMNYETGSGELTLRDALSTAPVKLQVAPDAVILQAEHAASARDLQPGALVSVAFTLDNTGHALARKISILAQPDTAFIFVGRVVHLDLRRGLLALVDPRDNKSYEISLGPSIPVPASLHEGASVSVNALFDGTHYTARTIQVMHN